MSSASKGTAAESISRKWVAGADRASTLSKHLGMLAVRGAAQFSYFLQHFTHGKQGADWELLELSNGAFYLRPTANAETVKLDVPISGFHGEVSLDAAGIVATLHMLNWLANVAADNDSVIDQYFALRKYALSLPEEPKIRAAID